MQYLTMAQEQAKNRRQYTIRLTKEGKLSWEGLHITGEPLLGEAQLHRPAHPQQVISPNICRAYEMQGRRL